MNFPVIGIIGAIIFFLFGGFAGLLLFVAIFAGVWYYFTMRAMLFIRSYVYLKYLRQTEDAPLANFKANAVSPLNSVYYIQEAMNYAGRVYHGAQLPVIAEARSLGFIAMKYR